MKDPVRLVVIIAAVATSAAHALAGTATEVTVPHATRIVATAGPHRAGTADAIVINRDRTQPTLLSGFSD